MKSIASFLPVSRENPLLRHMVSTRTSCISNYCLLSGFLGFHRVNSLVDGWIFMMFSCQGFRDKVVICICSEHSCKDVLW